VYNLRNILVLTLTALVLLVSCSNQENVDRDTETLPVGIGDDQNSDLNKPPQPTPDEEEPPQKITQCELGELIQGGVCAGEINGYFLILRAVDETRSIHWGNELPYVSQYLTEDDGLHNTLSGLR
jgi:hypothetical protein